MTAADDLGWLAWRAEGIGASDVAAAWSRRYGGRYGVVARKLGLIESDIDQHLADRGHRWEEPIADAVHALTGLYVVGEQSWCEHADHPHRRATVDGFLAATGEASVDDLEAVLEVKTVGQHVRPSWDYFTAQVQFQMHVTGLDRALLAVATIDDADDLQGLRLTWVDADPDCQTMLAAEADDLWSHVQAGTLPDPDCPDALDIVKRVTGRADADAEQADLDDIAAMVEEFGRIKTAVKEVTDRQAELEAVIKHRMGAATKGRAGTWRITYSQPARVLTTLAEEALLITYPELGHQTLDRDRAKRILGKHFDDWKEPVGARRLTIKEQQ